MTDYHYSGTSVLRNRFGYTDPDQLEAAEAAITAASAADLTRQPLAPTFDYELLHAIHPQLFGDLYGWAGEQRTINTVSRSISSAR